MGGESRDLVAVEIGHAQRLAVGRRPDGLDHVPEVEATGDEGLVAKCREGGEARGIGRDRRREQHPGARQDEDPSHSSRSMIARQRRPRTASLASRS